MKITQIREAMSVMPEFTIWPGMTNTAVNSVYLIQIPLNNTRVMQKFKNVTNES